MYYVDTLILEWIHLYVRFVLNPFNIQLTYKLSCNHIFHFTCFKNMYIKTNSFFTDCPNCRQLNTHIEIPFDDGYKNLKALCCSQVGKSGACVIIKMDQDVK